LHQERETAVLGLPAMVPEKDKRTALLKQVGAIVSANGAVMAAEEGRRLVRLSQVLPVMDDAPAVVARSTRAVVIKPNGDAGNRLDGAIG
jgi:hypothetical protein